MKLDIGLFFLFKKKKKTILKSNLFYKSDNSALEFWNFFFLFNLISWRTVWNVFSLLLSDLAEAHHSEISLKDLCQLKLNPVY